MSDMFEEINEGADVAYGCGCRWCEEKSSVRGQRSEGMGTIIKAELTCLRITVGGGDIQI